jgi:hypothetical protein
MEILPVYILSRQDARVYIYVHMFSYYMDVDGVISEHWQRRILPYTTSISYVLYYCCFLSSGAIRTTELITWHGMQLLALGVALYYNHVLQQEHRVGSWTTGS